MKALIIGAAGMIGRKLTQRLARAKKLAGRAIAHAHLVDMPGVSVTVGEQIEALREIAGEKAVKLIRRQPEETIARIVAGWPRNLDPARARELGFRADATFSAIINAYIEDELNG